MPTYSPLERNRLRALRARAERRGIAVDTSRRAISTTHLGGLMIRDIHTNTVIDGGRFELTLEEAEMRVAELIAAERNRTVDEASRKPDGVAYYHYDGTPCPNAGDVVVLPGMKPIRECTFGELRDAIPLLKERRRAEEERLRFEYVWAMLRQNRILRPKTGRA